MSIPLGPTTRSNSRFSRMRSRPQSGANIQGIDEAEEFGENLEKVISQIAPESPVEQISRTTLEIHNKELESEMNESMRGKNLKSNNSIKQTASTGKRESLANVDGAENVI